MRAASALTAAGAVVLAALFFHARSGSVGGRRTPGIERKAADMQMAKRIVRIQPHRAVEALGVSPGMCIVDIGAGTGIHTFLMADALKGTGQVFATDVDPEMIRELQERVRRGGYRNVSPVLVRRDGLDPFYGKHVFDRVLMSGVFDDLLDPVEYLKGLRPSIERRRGRVFVTYVKELPDFGAGEFGDFGEVVRILRANGVDFPVFRRLRKSLRDFVLDWRGAEVPGNVEAGILEDLSGMLLDRRLCMELIECYYRRRRSDSFLESELRPSETLRTFVEVPDLRLAHCLMSGLDAAGVFDERKKDIPEADRMRLRKLNRVLLGGIFQSARDASYHAYDDLFRLPVPGIISRFEAAGYAFVRGNDLSTYRAMLEFRRAR